MFIKYYYRIRQAIVLIKVKKLCKRNWGHNSLMQSKMNVSLQTEPGFPYIILTKMKIFSNQQFFSKDIALFEI